MFLAATFLLTKSPPIHPSKVAAKNVFLSSLYCFVFNEFAFTIQVKHK